MAKFKKGDRVILRTSEGKLSLEIVANVKWENNQRFYIFESTAVYNENEIKS